MKQLLQRPARFVAQLVGHWARGAAVTTAFTFKSGVMAAQRPGGIASFVRTLPGQKLGPHLLPMLHARSKPDKPAIIDCSGGMRRVLTYAEFDMEANRLAHGLAAMGVRQGDRVAIMLPNCAEFMIAQHACIRLGCTAVQVGTRLKAVEVAYILDNSQPAAVLVHSSYLGVMSAARAAAGKPALDMLIVCGTEAKPAVGVRYQDVILGQDGQAPPRGQDTDLSNVIVYTSGTTGKPKGATRNVNKTGLVTAMDFMQRIGMHHQDRHLVVCPLYHSAAPAIAVLMFVLGATVVIADHFDPEAVLALIARERITSAFMVPTMLIRINSLPDEVIQRHDCSSLRWVLSGAAPLATDTAVRFQERFGPILHNFYGATETGLVTLAGPADHAAHPGTIGRLLTGNEYRLIDNSGRDVPAGQVGELYVRNAMLISGYHRDTEATGAAMSQGFFSVGDLARVDQSGFFYLESRKHDMVISGGVNIYPLEIEEHLHTHPAVQEAAVVGVPDPEWGESLVAFVVTRDRASITPEEIMHFCRGGLADYKCPRHIELMPELPHSATGKVLKRELREQYLRQRDSTGGD